MPDDKKSPSQRYELGRVLGRGGMGVVYEARVKGAHGFERRVAFKQLRLRDRHGEDAGGAAVVLRSEQRRFFDEAKIAAKLHHGGIVSVLDYGILDDEPFQVLELVDGLNVATLMRQQKQQQGCVPEDVALFIAIEVAHALAYAHEATDDEGRPLGITHRDVKPSNVLISRSGDVKLADFGIAFAFSKTSKTTTGAITGTPTYMAPEQMLGGAVDGRTDVFSLGCTLHAMLAGASPLAGRKPYEIFTVDPTIDPSIAPDIAEVIRRATALNPQARLGSAKEMASALSPLVASRLRTDGRSRLSAWMAESSIKPDDTVVDNQWKAQTITLLDGANRTFTMRGGDKDVRPLPPKRRAPPAVAKTNVAAVRIFGLAAGLVVLIGLALGAAFLVRHSHEANMTTPAPTASSSVASLLPLDSEADTDASAEENALPPPMESSSSSSAASSQHTAAKNGIWDLPMVKDGCLCISRDRRPDTEALCHPQAVRVPRCSCGEQITMSFVECDEKKGVKCERHRFFPAGTKSGDACSAYPLISSLDDRSVAFTKPELQKDRLTCDVCSATRVYPRTHGGLCRGIHHSGSRQVIDGLIHCR